MENIKEWQQNADRLVSNNVYICQSHLVEKMLQSEVFCWDDMTNVYRYFDEVGEALEYLEDMGVNWWQELDWCFDDGLSEQQNIDDNGGEVLELANDTASDYPNEPLEWWVVSDWLADRLQDRGEVILENDYGQWWGRTCSGQAVAQDYIIQSIANN